MLAEAGVPEDISMQLVGHANQKMIHEVYLHLKASMLENATQLLNEHLNSEKR